MVHSVLYKYKNIILATILILTLPLWLPILNYIFESIIYAGRVVGTFIRSILAKLI